MDSHSYAHNLLTNLGERTIIIGEIMFIFDK